MYNTISILNFVKLLFLIINIKNYFIFTLRLPKISNGIVTIRNTQTPMLARKEKQSLLNITSKIMSASVNNNILFINSKMNL